MSEPVRRALLSVWDKSGLAVFARGLAEMGVTLMASGGTAEALRREGLRPAETKELTGFGSILGGRVKTLHPRVHAGILARRDRTEDIEEMRREEIALIDMVVVNFYPFPGADAAGEMDFAAMVELIDIGGPALLRGASKNCAHVIPVSRPDQYAAILAEMRAKGGEVSWETRVALARDAFAMASQYDGEIARYLAAVSARQKDAGAVERRMPESYSIWAPVARELAYGENPHQAAGFYRQGGLPPAGFAAVEVLGGKPLSYNNLLDTEALWRLLAEFDQPAAVIVKHNTPSGAAVHENVAAALREAIACDRESAFGGVFGVNRTLTADVVREIGDMFIEVLAFPDATPEALELMAAKKRVRLLRLPAFDRERRSLEVRAVAGGYLVQEADAPGFVKQEARVVTSREPSPEEWKSLEFAWLVSKHVKSNAIVFARGEKTIGIGAGQMSRVESVRLAARKAVERGIDLAGASLASDGFFPFPDNIDEAKKVGITSIIQPGGSIKDAEVIEAANREGMTMVFTGRRHFRH